MSKHPDILQLVKQGRLDLLFELNGKPDLEGAECNPENAELFYSDVETEIAEAKSICAACPVQAACLEWAVAYEDDGIHGGATPQERGAMRNGNPVVDIDRARRAQRDKVVIMTKPVKLVAATFDVEPRTVHRWRNEISAAEKIAS
jgi:WhiB family redox-sensing transcriptional regulator